MSGRGWYAEKEAKLKKEKVKQMKETNAISAITDGHVRKANGENNWVSNGTRTYPIYADEERKRKDYPQVLAMEIARKLCAKYGVAI